MPVAGIRFVWSPLLYEMLSGTFFPMFARNCKKQVGDGRVELSTPVFDDFRAD
jgi:hypothetical protein